MTFMGSWKGDATTATRGKMLSEYIEKQFFYVEMSSYELASMSKEDFVGYYNFFKIYEKQHPEDKFVLVGVPKGAMRNIQHDPRFVHVTMAAKARREKVSFIDLSPVDDLNSVLKEYSPAQFTELTKKLKNREVAADIRIVKALEKQYEKPDNRLPTKWVTKVLKVRCIIPATLETIGDTLKRYPLAHTLQDKDVVDSKRVSNIVRYIELEDCYAENKI